MSTADLLCSYAANLVPPQCVSDLLVNDTAFKEHLASYADVGSTKKVTDALQALPLFDGIIVSGHVRDKIKEACKSPVDPILIAPGVSVQVDPIVPDNLILLMNGKEYVGMMKLD